jgi:PAS domain S-box-containing protein
MSFNKMAFELKESQEKLLAYSRELESKVEERTMALTKANEHMQHELKERLRIERELGELFEYNRKLFEIAYIGIWIIDLVPLTEEDKLTDPNYFWHKQIGVKIITRNLNERMYGMLGLVREEMLGRSIFDPLFVDDTNAQIYMKEIIARREGKKGSYELTLRHKDGHAVPVLINAIPLVTDTKTGKTIQSVGVFTDLSDIKKMEEELLKAKKLESIGILAGGIAHDFNNLLTLILGNIEISRMFSKPGDKIFERLLDAEDACRKAGELSNRLITLSIGGEPFKEIASIAEIIREAASSSEVSCRIDLPDDLYHAAVDGRQIKQALGNILVNAKEAMPEGGIVKIKGENIAITEKDHLPLKDGDYIKISIEDRGTGISEGNLSKIFDPYFTTKGMGSEKGKGLGLTVSYSIIKKHDGLIAVESKVSEGTTLNIYLPAADSY